LISQLTSPHETITSCHPGYAIPNSNRVPDGTTAILSVHRFKEVSNVGYALRVLIYCVAAVGVGMPPSLLAFVGLALIGF
jgi:hypothetical protein